MSDLTSAALYITDDQSQVGSVAAETLAQDIGQTCNWIIDNAKSKPVGSITVSTLTEAQFQAAAGPGWILADGRALLVTDQFRILTGFTTAPNIRGAFPRGKAVADVMDGSTVLSENAAHNHSFIFNNGVAKVIPNQVFVDAGFEPENTFRMTATPGIGGAGNVSMASAGTQPEFAPVHVVENVFLRIN